MLSRTSGRRLKGWKLVISFLGFPFAANNGVWLRQSYLRVAKHAAMMAGRYAHAKQFKRQHRQLRLLRSRLGRIIRDFGRKIATNSGREAALQWPLARANQIRSQQQRPRLEIVFLPQCELRLFGGAARAMLCTHGSF